MGHAIQIDFHGDKITVADRFNCWAGDFPWLFRVWIREIFKKMKETFC